MRLRFEDGARDDLVWDEGEISLGGGPDDDIALPQSEPCVARLLRAPRRILLHVGPDARARVNGRSVAELALLRVGDLVEVGGMPMTLVSSRQNRGPAHGGGLDEFERAPAVAAQLRCLTGPEAGRLLLLSDAAQIGGQVNGQASAEATLSASPEAVVIRADAGSLMVNGHPVVEAMLRHGDQIRLGSDRWEVEAPAYRAGRPVSGQHDIMFREPARDPIPVPTPSNGMSRADMIIIAVCVAACAAMVTLVALRL